MIRRAFYIRALVTPSPQSNRIPNSRTKYHVENNAVECPVMVSFDVMFRLTLWRRLRFVGQPGPLLVSLNKLHGDCGLARVIVELRPVVAATEVQIP